MDRVAEHLIKSEDGTQLAAYHWSSSARRPASVNEQLCVVLVHQYTKMGGSSALMRGMAKCMTRHGFPVVTFDMRGAGKSLGRATWTGSAEIKDVVAVVKFVIQSLQQDVLLVGSSAGVYSGPLCVTRAPIAGSALHLVPEIRGYVAVGYVFGWLASWLFGRHYHAIAEAQCVPKLFIMGERDGFTSVSQLKARAAACTGTASVLVVPDVGHFQLETAEFDNDVSLAIVQWIDEHDKDLYRGHTTT